MRIFIPIDGSERSLNAVRYVANKPAFLGKDPEICIFIAMEPASTRIMSAFDPDTVDAFYREEASEVFRLVDDIFPNRSDNVTVSYGVGKIAETIVKGADDYKADFVIMGTTGKGSFDGLLMGSVSHEVLHESHRPIMLIREEMPSIMPLAHIVVAVDDSEQSRRVIAFLKDHIDHFKAGTQFDLIHVEKATGDKPEGTVESVPFVAGSVGALLESTLQHAGMKTTPVTIYGDAGPAIAGYADERPVDLVVMGTHGYSMLVATLVGSTALDVETLCDTPLLLVR